MIACFPFLNQDCLTSRLAATRSAILNHNTQNSCEGVALSEAFLTKAFNSSVVFPLVMRSCRAVWTDAANKPQNLTVCVQYTRRQRMCSEFVGDRERVAPSCDSSGPHDASGNGQLHPPRYDPGEEHDSLVAPTRHDVDASSLQRTDPRAHDRCRLHHQ